MAESEKYTLPRVLEIVRGHAEALGRAAQALEVTEGKDPEVLAMVGERALKASADLWAIDEDVGFTAGQRCEELFGVWYSDAAYPAVGIARNVLPLVVLAVGAVGGDPDDILCGIEQWRWCQEQTDSISVGLMEWVTAQEKDIGRPKENGAGTHTVSQPEEPREPKVEQLMPMEAFEAMADALRPLVSGLGDFKVSSEAFACFVDGGDSEDAELTHEGKHRITELAGIAVAAGRRLDDVCGNMRTQYLPDWCKSQLYEVRDLVVRIAWMLYGVEAATLGPGIATPPESPRWGAVHGFNIARDAYRDLCGKLDEYEAAQEVAIDQDYKDKGWTKDEDGRRIAPPEMLKEMEAEV